MRFFNVGLNVQEFVLVMGWIIELVIRMIFKYVRIDL